MKPKLTFIIESLAASRKKKKPVTKPKKTSKERKLKKATCELTQNVILFEINVRMHQIVMLIITGRNEVGPR